MLVRSLELGQGLGEDTRNRVEVPLLPILHFVGHVQLALSLEDHGELR